MELWNFHRKAFVGISLLGWTNIIRLFCREEYNGFLAGNAPDQVVYEASQNVLGGKMTINRFYTMTDDFNYF